MNDPAILRMIDANANRAREALRVLEDYARFALNDQQLSADLKKIRHTLAEVTGAVPFQSAILARDTAHDVGTTNKTPAELTRDSLNAIVIAAGKRLSESLRVLEECAKTISPIDSQKLEHLRYSGYILEQTLTRIAANADARARFAPVCLYILLTESLCHPSLGGWEHVLDSLLSAAINYPHQLCIQLREKNLPDAELLRRAALLADKCRRAHALSIINDRPDIALLTNADGIHLGQSDLPCAEARKVLGPDKIIGLSTESLPQAHQALRDGATYVAVGPMFPTTTKQKPRLATPAYAAEARCILPPEIPVVAIGGITLANLSELTTIGIQTVAVCSAILSSTDPAAATQTFLEKLSHFQ